jgi:hypothetical protein
VKVIKTYVSDDGFNIIAVGQKRGQVGVDVLGMGSWVTVDFGRSTERRQAKIFHHRRSMWNGIGLLWAGGMEASSQASLTLRTSNSGWHRKLQEGGKWAEEILS